MLKARTLLLVLMAMPSLTPAGVTVYEKDETSIEIGGRVQVLYERSEQDDGSTVDDIFFRRLRPYIAGTITGDWSAKIEFDFGEASDGDEVEVKDAYARWSGWDNHTLSIGNTKTPFSREFLTSSAKQQLVERTFVGDHNFGGPDRQIGLLLSGQNGSRKVTWSAAVGSERHDPDIRKMDFDSPASDEEDWNHGFVYAGRVDVHPLGFMKYDQADFHSEEWLFTVGAAAFAWNNDGDNNTFTDPDGMTTSLTKVDLDSAHGYELSGGVRGRGVSVDLEVQRVTGETVDSAFTGGLYEDGETDLDKMAIEGGYVLPGNRVEIVAGWDTLDATNYEKATDRTSVGVNLYINEHNAKFQTTWQKIDNAGGVRGDDRDALWVSFQVVF